MMGRYSVTARQILAFGVAVALAAALQVAAVIGLAAPALAAPNCPVNRFCLHDSNFTGPHIQVEPVDTVLNQCVGVNNPFTSWITNNTNYRWIVSTSYDCAANRGIVYPHSAGAMVAPWNNNIRGFYRTSQTSFTAVKGVPAVLG